MAEWNPNLYLRYERERTQPSIDLANAIGAERVRRALDIGCGPGNSTAVLKRRWSEAEVLGVDSSEAMIGKARDAHPDISFALWDATGPADGLGQFDVVFSNAALQWMPDHEAMLAKWYGMVKPGGEMAAQVPLTRDMPVQRALMELASGPKYASKLGGIQEHSNVSYTDYYDMLCGLGRPRMWQTDYIHILDSHQDIVDWYSGTTLRPYMERLAEGAGEEFLEEFLRRVTDAYPKRADGRVLFPFRRIFFILRRE